MSSAHALAMKLAPQTARQARLLRLANQLSRDGVRGAPTSETDKLAWVHSQARFERDKRLSREEEQLRAKLIPVAMGKNAVAAHTNANGDNLFHFREYPMFPGEYVPPEHNTLASVRDELRADLTAQSVKQAWLAISGGRFFKSPGAFYEAADGLDEGQLADIVNAVFPDFDTTESGVLVQRILESLSTNENTAKRRLSATLTADTLGLDDTPGHYTNFLEWMGRITSSKAFATENSIYQFCRRAFNQQDVRIMFDNYSLLSADAVKGLSADSYSHFYQILKDYSMKVAGSDTRSITGVRIDPAEYDPETGIAVAYGRHDDLEVYCLMRPNFDATGSVNAHGRTLAETLKNKSWHMERILAPLDEAGLSFKDYDVYFQVSGNVAPNLNGSKFAMAAQFALANAICKLVPVARIPLKKAGYLSFDRRQLLGDQPGYLNLRRKQRFFAKRQAKAI